MAAQVPPGLVQYSIFYDSQHDEDRVHLTLQPLL